MWLILKEKQNREEWVRRAFFFGIFEKTVACLFFFNHKIERGECIVKKNFFEAKIKKMPKTFGI